jgi:hypothetical protein
VTQQYCCVTGRKTQATSMSFWKAVHIGTSTSTRVEIGRCKSAVTFCYGKIHNWRRRSPLSLLLASRCALWVGQAATKLDLLCTSRPMAQAARDGYGCCRRRCPLALDDGGELEDLGDRVLFAMEDDLPAVLEVGERVRGVRVSSGVDRVDLPERLARDDQELALGLGDAELLHAKGTLEVVRGQEAHDLDGLARAGIPLVEPVNGVLGDVRGLLPHGDVAALDELRAHIEAESVAVGLIGEHQVEELLVGAHDMALHRPPVAQHLLWLWLHRGVWGGGWASRWRLA